MYTNLDVFNEILVINYRFLEFTKYEGQSVNSDSGSFYQKILLESELFVTQTVDMGAIFHE